jgi:IS5 family transposase
MCYNFIGLVSQGESKMLGKRSARQPELFVAPPGVPETPARRLLVRIDELVDFEFVRELVAFRFAESGRPSLDPVVVVKMMLIGCLFGIESDRRLVEECADRLSFREFLGYSLSEALPVHASLTHWRQRLGSAFFREVLHEIVRQCVAQGIELSRARTVDAMSVKAQADLSGPCIVVPWGKEIDEFVDEYFANETPVAGGVGKGALSVNTHDPEARLQKKPGEPRTFRYQASFAADADTGIITDATATPTEKPQTAVDHVDCDPGEVRELAADSRYDDSDTLAQLQARGVTTYVPKTKHDKPGQISRDEFTYDEQRNSYLCPMGKRLDEYYYDQQRGIHSYVSKQKDCRDCPLKPRCTKAKRRTVTRTHNHAARDAAVRNGTRYRQLSKRRKVNEHLNLLAKRDHAMRRARGLGLDSVRIQAALVATAINLKKLVRLLGHDGPLAAALQLSWALVALTRRLQAQARSPMTIRAI